MSLFSAMVLVLGHSNFGEVYKGKKRRQPYLDMSFANKDRTQHGNTKSRQLRSGPYLTPILKKQHLGRRRQDLRCLLIQVDTHKFPLYLVSSFLRQYK